MLAPKLVSVTVSVLFFLLPLLFAHTAPSFARFSQRIRPTSPPCSSFTCPQDIIPQAFNLGAATHPGQPCRLPARSPLFHETRTLYPRPGTSRNARNHTSAQRLAGLPTGQHHVTRTDSWRNPKEGSYPSEVRQGWGPRHGRFGKRPRARPTQPLGARRSSSQAKPRQEWSRPVDDAKSHNSGNEYRRRHREGSAKGRERRSGSDLCPRLEREQSCLEPWRRHRRASRFLGAKSNTVRLTSQREGADQKGMFELMFRRPRAPHRLHPHWSTFVFKPSFSERRSKHPWISAARFWVDEQLQVYTPC